MKIFRRAVAKIQANHRYRFGSETFVNSTFYDVVSQAKPNHCLDICSGIEGVLDNKFVSVDINPELVEEGSKDIHRPDFVGDILACFAPFYCNDEEFLSQNEDVLGIEESYWSTVRVKHGIEHIPWRYQTFLFKWLYDLLASQGILYIATPNLGYIFGVYEMNREKQRHGELPVYPISEHTYCKEGVSWHMQQWAWFKLFSGGSPGDNHFCCHDAFSLGNILYEAGFRKITIFDGHTLIAVAKKIPLGRTSLGEDTLDLSVKSAIGDR